MSNPGVEETKMNHPEGGSSTGEGGLPPAPAPTPAPAAAQETQSPVSPSSDSVNVGHQLRGDALETHQEQLALAASREPAAAAAMDIDDDLVSHPSVANSHPVTETPPPGASVLDATIASLTRYIENESEKLARGDITELSLHTMEVMDKVYNAIQLRNAAGIVPARRSDSGSGSGSGGGSVSGGRSGSGGRGGGNSNRNRRSKGKTPAAPRPRCTYSKCKKPLGHTFETCFQRQRDERDEDSGNGGSSGGGSGGGGGGKRAKNPSTSNN
ncbi:unnamed protein product [Ectocarpus sp. CCAP 1310/34]|nr:unnamed protein product [Ectocarpus sp. CCAP 1310/34]